MRKNIGQPRRVPWKRVAVRRPRRMRARFWLLKGLVVPKGIISRVRSEGSRCSLPKKMATCSSSICRYRTDHHLALGADVEGCGCAISKTFCMCTSSPMVPSPVARLRESRTWDVWHEGGAPVYIATLVRRRSR